MVRCNLHKNYFGCVSFILIHNAEFSSSNIKKLTDIFDTKHCMTKILALDRNDNFFKAISNERYSIIFPIKDTITSETVVMSNLYDLLSKFEILVNSEPRCISIYEIKNQDRLNDMLSNCKDEYLIKKGTVDYVISMIVEESCIKITFNANRYEPRSLFLSIKEAKLK